MASSSCPETTIPNNPEIHVTNNPETIVQHNPQQSGRYIILERTTLIPAEKLEVVCKLMIDLENLRDNGFNLFLAVEFQGWRTFFDCLIGPVFPNLVKEF